MKKGLFILLALIMCLASACAPAVQDASGADAAQAPAAEAPAGKEAPAAADSGANTDGLPAIGDQIGDFVLRSVTPMDVIGAKGLLFEHEGTGAQLLYLASSDPNVSFDITFRTPALDDTGKAHVFEHMTICGSQKYPDPNLFFPFCNRTYNTYVNAATYNGMTTYPLSSLSEEQLMSMMDYYLSGVFSPLMKTEPRMVDREAWRYEMADADAPITIAGTVYSEMQGALSPMRLSVEYIRNTMFKDGLTAHVSGGLPEAIRQLTWEDLTAFHDTYYHPSNALIVLYGDLDYQRFLQYIDGEYLSKFHRKEIAVERGQVVPYTETAYATYQVPVEAAAQTEDASYLSYDFSYNGMPMDDALALDVLVSLLNSDASPLKRLAGERMPGVDVSCMLDVDNPSPVLTFYAPYVNESDRDTFVKLVDDVIAQLAGGVEPDQLDAAVSMAKLQLMLTAEDATLGVNASQAIALFWTNFGSTGYYSDYARVVDEMTVERMNRLVQTYLADNTYRGVSLTVPAPGMAEKAAQELAAELAEKKAAMSDEEIGQMLQKAQAFSEWSGAAPDEEIIHQLAMITVDKLPELLPEGTLTDETVDGVRFITVAADVGDITQTTIALDASAIPVEKLQDAAVAASLLGSVDTAKHSKEELNVLLRRYLGVLECRLRQIPSIAEGVPDLYALHITTLGLGEKAGQGYELVEEVLLQTDFTDIDNIKNALTQKAYAIRNSLDDDPLSIQMDRSQAMFFDTAAVVCHTEGIALYNRINELLALADSDPARLTSCLRDALECMLNRYQATVLSAGSSGSNNAYLTAVKALLKKLPETKTTPVDYSALRPEKANEALVNNLTVHMNVLTAPAESYSGKNDVTAYLIADRFLMPKLRNVLGAYGAYCSFGMTTNFLYTYRDPNLASTYQAFADLPEQIRTAELTQADVDSYIVGAYNGLLPSGGKLSQALTLAEYRMRGITDDMLMNWMREAKATTPEDVLHAADLVESILENGVRSVSGAESTLQEAAELTDVTIRIDQADAAQGSALEPAA